MSEFESIEDELKFMADCADGHDDSESSLMFMRYLAEFRNRDQRLAALREELAKSRKEFGVQRGNLNNMVLHCKSLDVSLTAAEQRNSDDLRDANRYRYLRDPDNRDGLEPEDVIVVGIAEGEDIVWLEQMDQAIDGQAHRIGSKRMSSKIEVERDVIARAAAQLEMARDPGSQNRAQELRTLLTTTSCGACNGCSDGCRLERESPPPCAESQVEPVAWGTMQPEFADDERTLITDKAEADHYNDHCYELTPLYTSPPAPVAVVLPSPDDLRYLVSRAAKQADLIAGANYYTAAELAAEALIDKIKELNQ